MLADIHDKGQGKIDNDGRPEGDEGGVNEEQPDAGRRHSKLFTQPGADTKGITFKKYLNLICKSVHT
jgi:hypothetical protein